MRTFEVETSYGSPFNSPRPTFSGDRVGLEVIIISYDSGSEGMFGTSFEGETSSLGSLDALILNIGEGTDRVEVLMPLSSLSG